MEYQGQHGWLALPSVAAHRTGAQLALVIHALAFVIFLVAAFAETNRTPFDLPEAEQELAGGYNVEYSSMKFALFFMGEYANMTAAVGDDGDAVLRRLDAAVRPGLDQPAATLWAWACCTSAFSWRRCCFIMFMIIWVRWMWPRFRYDQLMDLGWRRFIPLALANIVVTAVVLWVRS